MNISPALTHSWRWFGDQDPIPLFQLRQMGVEGVVSALHQIPNGAVWPLEEIRAHKRKIEAEGLKWVVVESLPVSEGIKTRSQDWNRLIEHYIQSMQNLAACGIPCICYNFMPVLDWARTDLGYSLASGAVSMAFDYPTFAAFDVFILGRPRAETDYPDEVLNRAEELFSKMGSEHKEHLAYSIIVATQGFIDGVVDPTDPRYKERFLSYIETYNDIRAPRLRENLIAFLEAIIPTAEACGIRMAIHPDDPPFPVLGLPRIVSTFEDFLTIFSAVPSLANGLTYCTGSLSVGAESDLYQILDTYAERIHFAHLRNTQKHTGKNFFESGHLEGRADMYRVVKQLLREQVRRVEAGRADHSIPVRPDHGLKILDDMDRESLPGYPLIGRLKGLAEIKGLEMGIARSMG